MSKRLAGNGRKAAAVAAATAVVSAAALVATAAPASAWYWDPTVTLNGKIGCNYATSNTVTWAWVSASDGEAGWASLSAGGMTRPYSFTFRNVPSSGMTVRVNWGCSTDGQHTTSFGVNRPSWGTTATRNVCYWWPCYL
jgi:hypothetical protein